MKQIRQVVVRVVFSVGLPRLTANLVFSVLLGLLSGLHLVVLDVLFGIKPGVIAWSAAVPLGLLEIVLIAWLAKRLSSRRSQ